MNPYSKSGQQPDSDKRPVVSVRKKPEFTFTREQRLLKGTQFNHVFAAPRRSSDRFFTVLVRENNGVSARLGLAVAKKRIRLAVRRNLVKRLIRESFRSHAKKLGAVDIVVLSRFDGKADKASISRSLLSHWKRLGVTDH